MRHTFWLTPSFWSVLVRHFSRCYMTRFSTTIFRETMLEQCCNSFRQRRSNVATLWCTGNPHCEPPRVTSQSGLVSFLSPSELGYGFDNSIPGEFGCFWQVGWVELMTIKMKRTPRNQFVSTVFTAVAVLYIRELKMKTFSRRRRPDWQRKPGTKAAVAPRQK